MVESKVNVRGMDSRFLMVHAGKFRFLIRINSVDNEGQPDIDLIESFENEADAEAFVSNMQRTVDNAISDYVAKLGKQDDK